MNEGISTLEHERLPKSELHVHLRGSISPRLVKRLCQNCDVDEMFSNSFSEEQRESMLEVSSIKKFLLGGSENFEKLLGYTNYTDFLKTYLFTGVLFRSAKDIGLLVDDVASRLLSQGVVYAEITISYWEYIERGIPGDLLVKVLRKRTEEAEKKGIYINWIVDLVRNYGPDLCDRILTEVHAHGYDRFVAITIGGDERTYQPEQFVDVFQRARELGFRLTIHSGEALGPASMWTVLKLIKPDRIGHGVRCIEDPSLVNHLKVHKIPLEICLTSNVLLGLCKSYSNHPIGQLVEAGVDVSINTDDPGFFNTSLSQEIDLAHSAGVSKNQMIDILRNGFKHAFLDVQRKAEYIDLYDKAIKSLLNT